MPNKTVRITVGDDVYDIDFSDLTAVDAKDFRREVGIPLAAVLADKEDADIDVIAGLVWIVRRKAEKGLTFDTVAKSISFTTTLDLDATPDGGDPPEA